MVLNENHIICIIMNIKPFMPNVFSLPYQLGESIFIFGGLFCGIFKGNFCFAASYLVLHCWPMSHKKDTRLINMG